VASRATSKKLYRRYKDRATFVMVYVRDAHPTDGWRMESNDRVGAVTAQPTTYDERVAVAQKCGRVLNLGFPMLVDTIDDSVGARYSGIAGPSLPDRSSGKGRVQERPRPLPLQAAEMEQSLVLLLQDKVRRRLETRVSLRGDLTPGALDDRDMPPN